MFWIGQFKYPWSKQELFRFWFEPNQKQQCVHKAARETQTLRAWNSHLHYSSTSNFRHYMQRTFTQIIHTKQNFVQLFVVLVFFLLWIYNGWWIMLQTFVYSRNQLSKFHNHMDMVHCPLHLLCLKKGEGTITGCIFPIYPTTEACYYRSHIV